MRSSESDVPHLALNHTFIAFICRGGRLWSLPGILQAAMHISFVLGRHRLISMYNHRDPSISSNANVHFTLQRYSCFVFRIRMRKSSVQHCFTVTQRLFTTVLCSGAERASTLEPLHRICLVLARESRNKAEDMAKCSETGTYFTATVCKAKRSLLSMENSTWF